ncbi:MAG: mechanosensitive ion channel [Symploca sp. SIO2C1]|nr:mechanosensitive ion channel [Symploca sp. SIO2C1]
MLRYRVRAILFTAGMICAFTVGWSPARSQEAEVEEAAVEEVQEVEIPTGDPTAAITTKDTDIPVDELKLLVKPLTLEELENEAAAWLEVLKRRAQTISEAEIAVKRQNLSIEQKEEAASQLEKAKEALAEAEKAQEKAEPGTPEYEDVTKKVEEAKENLSKAEEAIEQAVATQEALQEDEGLKESLKKAQRKADYDAANETVERAEKEREELEPGSAEYERATEKIDQLKEAIKLYEETGEIQGDAIPDTPEFEKAQKDFLDAQKAMNKAREAIDGVESDEADEADETDAADETDEADEADEADETDEADEADETDEIDETDQSSEALDDTAALLEGTEIEADGEEKVAGSPEVVDTEDNLEEKQEQLDKASENLAESAEEEADLKNNLVETVTALQSLQTGIIDRFKVVLDELDNKGGNSEAYRKYIEAVSGIEFDVTDTEGLGVRLISWAKSEEGGIRWLINIATFIGVLAGSIIASQLLAHATLKFLLKYGDESQTLRDFIVMLIKRGGVVLGVLLALTALEVSLGPIIALVGGASFVLAFALQSNLGNFASGLTLMLAKPFDVGDEVKVAGLWGYIDSVTLASTKIKGWDSQIITLPNSMVWGSIIENLTTEEFRRGGVPVLVSFDTDLRRVKEILNEIGKSHPLILQDRSVGAYIYKGTEHFVWTGIKYWSKTDDYWTVYEDLAFMIQERFAKEGIQIAMPQQQDIRIQYTPNGKTPKQVSQVPAEAFEPHKVSQDSSDSPVDDPHGEPDIDVPDFM